MRFNNRDDVDTLNYKQALDELESIDYKDMTDGQKGALARALMIESVVYDCQYMDVGSDDYDYD